MEHREDGSSGEARFSTRSIMTGTVLPGPRSNQSKSCLLLPIQPATSRFSPACPLALSLFPTPFLFHRISTSFSSSHPSPPSSAPSCLPLLSPSLSLSFALAELFRSLGSLLNRAIQRGRPFARFLFPGAEPGRTGSARI